MNKPLSKLIKNDVEHKLPLKWKHITTGYVVIKDSVGIV